jgi:2-oxoisovalerate dehydrogenase E2 component (dihydrolipoyl transacylase)
MDFRLPELGEGVYEAELVAWHIKPGDVVHGGQNLLEVLTDKATMEVPAPFAGAITAVHGEPGAVLKVGDLVLEYQPAGQPSQPPSTAARSQEAVGARTATSSVAKSKRRAPSEVNGHHADVAATPAHVKAAPSVRLMARKLGIDLARLPGTGPEGRILLEDLSRQLQAVSGKTSEPSEISHPEYGIPGTKVKLNGLRRKIAEHMVASKKAIPHYSYIDELDATQLVQLRDTLKEDFAAAGAKLTYLAFAIRAVAAALQEVPMVNATLHEESGEIELFAHYHIGFAVATPAGLVAPVIHDVNEKELTQVAAEIERLSSAARTGKLKLEELRGGTFTITSIGNIGGLISTPIIHQPQVGIMGMGKIVRRPVFDDAGTVRPADMMYLSFSFDHRVVDGAVGAAFGNAVIRRLSQPARLLLPASLTGA